MSLLPMLLALAGCGEDGGGGAGGGAAGGASQTPSYATDIEPIFISDQGCYCHNMEGLGAPFNLLPGEGYGNIVNVASQQVPSMLLVAPGSLNDSYLWIKMQNTQTEVGGGGQKMPPGFSLTVEELDLVGRWIAGGAAP
ncbi:MAG: hypothetical protein OEZ06_16100 [Myxococcales bacterium]|nr:hypothetical protein [Myxococcales bacterium]